MFRKIRLARTLSIAGAILTVSGVSLGIAGTTTYASDVGPGVTVFAGNPDYSTAGKACDPDRDGYHFIMNGLEYAAGAVIDGNDFGPILISFSNGSTATATFTDCGHLTAHFLNNTVNQSGNFTIESAQMTFPAGTDITAFNQFRISHPPCGTVGSTTTTTTTVAATTHDHRGCNDDHRGCDHDDVAATTTRRRLRPRRPRLQRRPLRLQRRPLKLQRRPPKVRPREAAGTTTTAAATTTSEVASEAPFLPTTTSTVARQVAAVPVPVPSSLPVTGKAAGPIAILGLFLLGAGLTLWGLSRRPHSLGA